MIAWLFLAGAILTEVTAALSLRAATHGARAWYAVVVVGYVTAFGLLALALAEGLPLGVAYGVWSAAGVALTALLGSLLFSEPFSWIMAAGIALIVGGVVLVQSGAAG